MNFCNLPNQIREAAVCLDVHLVSSTNNVEKYKQNQTFKAVIQELRRLESLNHSLHLRNAYANLTYSQLEFRKQRYGQFVLVYGAAHSHTNRRRLGSTVKNGQPTDFIVPDGAKSGNLTT